MRAIYKDVEALASIEEPYKTVLTIIEEMYINGPEGGSVLDSRGFLDYMAINCIRNICERIKHNPIRYVASLLESRGRLYQEGRARQNAFEQGYRVGLKHEATVIFGGVYYVFSCDGTFDKRKLDNLEKIGTWNGEKALVPYFTVFKEYAAKTRSEDPQKDNVRDYKTDVKNAKGLSPSQSCLFVEGLLKHLGVTYSNKKEIIPPYVEQLFGWTKSTSEKRVTEGYSKEDRNLLADILKGTKLAEIYRDFQNTANSGIEQKVNRLVNQGEPTGESR